MKKKISSEHIDIFHTHGIYHPTRSINLIGEIDEDQFNKTLTNLHILDSEDGDINIFLCSSGGILTYGQAIYDAIKGCRNYVKVVVYGEASSAASIIMQAADKRLMLPNSYIMLHVGSEAYADDTHPENIKRWRAKSEKDTEWMQQIYLNKLHTKKPKFSKKALEEMLKFDTIISAKEAVDLGLADEVIEGFTLTGKYSKRE